MFEALFILTTLDAGTRVGRYILQDFLGNVWKPLGDTKALGPNLLASGLMVAGWGYFLIQGVRDPLGGINSLWPLFGIANQMLAAIALCLATTIILKTALQRRTGVAPVSDLKEAGMKFETGATPVVRSRWLVLVTLVPLVWLLLVTFTAGVQKIYHSDPRIGFLSQARSLKEKLPDLEAAVATAQAAGDTALMESAEKALRTNRTLYFNNVLDAGVAGVFLCLVSVVVLFSVREWILLLSQRKPAVLRETEPVWLPDYAVTEGGRNFTGAAGTAALAVALARELSGEAHLDRAHQQAAVCECRHATQDEAATQAKPRTVKSDQQIYVEVTEQRFNGVRRCC
jgi:carbon starvation protein